MQADKDRHQDEIIGIQESYDFKMKALKSEIDTLNAKCDSLQDELNAKSEEVLPVAASKPADDGWCLNDSDIQLDTKAKDDFDGVLCAKNEEILQLQNQVKSLYIDAVRNLKKGCKYFIRSIKFIFHKNNS